jgi:hypothetical protein
LGSLFALPAHGSSLPHRKIDLTHFRWR